MHWITWFRVGCLTFRMQRLAFIFVCFIEKHRRKKKLSNNTLQFFSLSLPFWHPFSLWFSLALCVFDSFNAYAFLLLLFLGLHGCCELSRCKIYTLTRICDGIRRAHVLLKLSVESKVQRQRGVCVLGSHDKFGSYVAYPKYPSKPKTEKKSVAMEHRMWESFFTAVFFHVLGEIVS